MSYFPGYTRSDELYHYGVKGMKWGVRRYQNYDGSYTQKGLERFRKSEAKYDKAKSQYDAAKSSGDKSGAKVAKSSMRSAKREMNRDYKQLKLDKRADEGKELYKQGKTITENNLNKQFIQGLFGLGSVPASMIIRSLTTDNVVPVSFFVTSEAMSAGYSWYINNQNKKLRAYYSHSPRITPN